MSLLPDPLKPYLVAIQVGASAVALLGAGYLGWHLQGLRCEAYKADLWKASVKAREDAATHERAAVKLALEARDVGEATQAQIKTTYRIIAERVPLYVPPENTQKAPALDGPWSLPLGAVRVHDYAALGVEPPIPAPSGEPLGAPSGIELPALLTTVSNNYGVCAGYREEAQRWRDWYAKELKAWPVANP